MFYFAKILKSDDVYLVSFPDFPNINTYGENHEEAIDMASKALNASLESDFERGFSLPEPTKSKKRNFHEIKVAPHIEVAFQLKRIRKNRSQIEIAKKLGIFYQAYQKLENPRKCNPTIKTLEKISSVFGKKLEIEFV